MAEIRLTRVEQGQTKIRNVPIAVTPEGFWCCPSPIVFQKTLKSQNPINKTKTSPPRAKTTVPKRESTPNEKKSSPTSSKSDIVLNDQRTFTVDGGGGGGGVSASIVTDRVPKPKIENLPRKVAIEFGEHGTSDLKVVLLGKHGFTVKLSVHRDVLVGNSSFFSEKLGEQDSSLSGLEIDECDDVEIHVETIGLMYCKEMKQRLIKQSVSRVLRILKVAKLLGFTSCVHSCLEYLEAVPWVGDEEEEKVVSSVLRLKEEGIGVTPVLKRVSPEVSNAPKDTLSHIIQLVLKSNEERGRRDTKSIVLKLLRENSNNINNNNSNYNYNLSSSSGSVDLCNETIYNSCRSCLNSLLSLFKQASEPEFTEKPTRQIALEADNILWLIEILVDRQAADELAVMWASQQGLASLHSKLPIMSRYHISFITARIYIGIGKGELLPLKDTRLLLLQTWLQPLIDDYSWLQHGSRSFDRKVVEEGIGQTILTLPLEDQQSILLAWLGSFLKFGDNCPNLQRAFEVWWRRTFIRPYAESQGSVSSHTTQ